MNYSVDATGTDNPETDDSNGSFGGVISYEDGTLVLDQEAMVAGHPYATVFEGVPVVVLKRESGDVDFYYIGGSGVKQATL